MAEMKVVEPRSYKPENRTVKQFKLGVRNFINKHRGQDELIEKYNAAIMAIATASDKSQSGEFKKRALDVLRTIEGGEMVTDGIASWEQGSFNPYKPFQKKLLRQKIAQLNAAMQELGISR